MRLSCWLKVQAVGLCTRTRWTWCFPSASIFSLTSLVGWQPQSMPGFTKLSGSLGMRRFSIRTGWALLVGRRRMALEWLASVSFGCLSGFGRLQPAHQGCWNTLSLHSGQGPSAPLLACLMVCMVRVMINMKCHSYLGRGEGTFSGAFDRSPRCFWAGILTCCVFQIRSRNVSITHIPAPIVRSAA